MMSTSSDCIVYIECFNWQAGKRQLRWYEKRRRSFVRGWGWYGHGVIKKTFGHDFGVGQMNEYVLMAVFG